MASPSSSLATLRPDLAGSLEEFSLEYNMLGFIGLRVFPIFDVASAAGVFGRIPIEELLAERETARSSGSGYSRGDMKFVPDSYTCSENGTEEPIDDRESAIYSEYFDHELVSTLRARHIVMLKQERRIAAKVFNTTTYTGSSLFTDVSATSNRRWIEANYTTMKPIDDVQAAFDKVEDSTGVRPNAVIMNHRLFRDVARSSQVIDALVAQGAGDRSTLKDLNEALVASALGVDEVIVAKSNRNTANKGQTVSIDRVWSSLYCSVARIAQTQDIREPCIGRTMHYSGDGSQEYGLVETYRDETVRGDVVRVRHDTDEKVLYTEMAHLLQVRAS